MIEYRKHNVLVSTTKPRKDGGMSVIYRVSYCGRQESLYSGLTVTNKQWDQKSKRFKQGCIIKGTPYNILNDIIMEHIRFITGYFNECYLRKVDATLSELKKRFNYQYKKVNGESGNEFFFAYQQFIDETSKTRMWDKDMLSKQLRIKNKLQEKYPNMSFPEITHALLNLIMEDWSQTQNNPTLHKSISDFKRFLKWADDKKYPVNQDYNTFNPKLLPTHKDVRYLTIDELNLIRDLQLEEGSTICKVRDCFLFQCGTALRFSDIKKLRKNEIIKDDKGNLCVKTVTEKDNGGIDVPLCEIAIEIYNKYKSFDYPNGAMFPVISNQKYNDYLKQIGASAGLQGEWVDTEYHLNERVERRTPKRDLGSHTARRTFICIAINEGVSTDLVAGVTSHADVKAMKPYIQVNKKGTTKVIEAFNQATKRE